MSNALFARIQHLLETMQEKSRKAEERLLNSERQVSALAQKVQTLEQQVAILRAAAMQGK